MSLRRNKQQTNRATKTLPNNKWRSFQKEKVITFVNCSYQMSKVMAGDWDTDSGNTDVTGIPVMELRYQLASCYLSVLDLFGPLIRFHWGSDYESGSYEQEWLQLSSQWTKSQNKLNQNFT